MWDTKKDKNNHYIFEGSIVVLNKHIYFVSGFDYNKENFVQLSNGLIKSQCKPEDCYVVDSIKDIKE